MLVEFKKVRQEQGQGLRRWFQDKLYELVVWYRPDGSLDGFQIHYHSGPEQRALDLARGQGIHAQPGRQRLGIAAEEPGSHTSAKRVHTVARCSQGV